MSKTSRNTNNDHDRKEIKSLDIENMYLAKQYER